MLKPISILIASALAVSVTNTVIAQHAYREHQTEQAYAPGHEHEKMQKYTCRMHPEVITDQPGNCPKCGMKLVPLNEKKRRTSNVQRSTSKVEAIDPNRLNHEHDHPSSVAAAPYVAAGEHEHEHEKIRWKCIRRSISQSL